ncbi:hypothetical protein ACPPVV_04715 [Rhodanobacter sp. Col0626]
MKETLDKPWLNHEPGVDDTARARLFADARPQGWSASAALLPHNAQTIH